MSLDDEVLPVTPVDVATPFILSPGARTRSLLHGALYPTQGDPAQIGLAGELRGLYGEPASLTWQPAWSMYRANRNGHTHWGVDIYAPVGHALVAVTDGELSFRTQAGGGGLGLYAVLTVVVQGKPYEFHYGHLDHASGAARSVPKGEIIGYVGCSGNADYAGTCSAAPGGHGITASHVHFALLPPPALGTPQRSNPLTVLGWDLHVPSKPNWM